MNDEELYLDATNEVDSENKNPGLWAKVIALSEGDQDKAKYKYIKLRVEQLSNDRKNAKPNFTRKSVDEFDLKYMPVGEFSKIKSIPEDKVIKMIRDGFYMGQIKNEAWYVSRDEVKNLDQPPSTAKQHQKEAHSEKKEYVPVEEFAEFKGITPEKAIQMIRDGLYRGQIIDDKWYASFSEISEKNNANNSDELGFQWWQVWAWLGLTIGNIYTFGALSEQIGLAVFLIILNSILMIMVLKYNKYAFLIATILSLNPLLWIINGIYLKNRWNHPKVNVPLNM